MSSTQTTDMAIHVTPTLEADATLGHERENNEYLKARGAHWAIAYANGIKKEAEAATDGGKSGITRTFSLTERKRRSDEVVVFSEGFIQKLTELLTPKFTVEVAYSEDVTNPLAPKRALVITARPIS